MAAQVCDFTPVGLTFVFATPAQVAGRDVGLVHADGAKGAQAMQVELCSTHIHM